MQQAAIAGVFLGHTKLNALRLKNIFDTLSKDFMNQKVIHDYKFELNVFIFVQQTA